MRKMALGMRTVRAGRNVEEGQKKGRQGLNEVRICDPHKIVQLRIAGQLETLIGENETESLALF